MHIFLGHPNIIVYTNPREATIANNSDIVLLPIAFHIEDICLVCQMYSMHVHIHRTIVLLGWESMYI